jgi:hypothetical protein
VEVEQLQSDPWTLYLYAMKSSVTRDKYQKRLGKFYEFIGLADLPIEKYFLIIFNCSCESISSIADICSTE